MESQWNFIVNGVHLVLSRKGFTVYEDEVFEKKQWNNKKKNIQQKIDNDFFFCWIYLKKKKLKIENNGLLMIPSDGSDFIEWKFNKIARFFC
jgi:hypothetical protein